MEVEQRRASSEGNGVLFLNEMQPCVEQEHQRQQVDQPPALTRRARRRTARSIAYKMNKQENTITSQPISPQACRTSRVRSDRAQAP